MRPHLKSLSFATATLFSLTVPLFLFAHLFLPAVAQTTQNRKAEAIRLSNEGEQLQQRGQYREALPKFQQALVIGVRVAKP